MRNAFLAIFVLMIEYNYLNDREDACNDLDKAGELGWKETYDVIKKICK